MVLQTDARQHSYTPLDRLYLNLKGNPNRPFESWSRATQNIFIARYFFVKDSELSLHSTQEHPEDEGFHGLTKSYCSSAKGPALIARFRVLPILKWVVAFRMATVNAQAVSVQGTGVA
jgi:hypothetical protein